MNKWDRFKPSRWGILIVACLFAYAESAAQTTPATLTPTATPTWNPTFVACGGDCDGDAAVTVDELVRAVNIALGALPLEDCPSADINGSGTVTVGELITAVSNALNGCGFVPPTSPPTSTRTSVGSATVTGAATATATATVTLTHTHTRLPSGTPTQTGTRTTTPTRTPTSTPTPLGTESVCGGYVTSVPLLCSVQVVPNPVRLGGAFQISYCLSDLEGNVNQFCLGIQTTPSPPLLSCQPFVSPKVLINTCTATGLIPFTNPVGTYVVHVQFRDGTGYRSEVVTSPFQVVP